jgi:hypothetical protein
VAVVVVGAEPVHPELVVVVLAAPVEYRPSQGQEYTIVGVEAVVVIMLDRQVRAAQVLVALVTAVPQVQAVQGLPIGVVAAVAVPMLLPATGLVEQEAAALLLCDISLQQ